MQRMHLPYVRKVTRFHRDLGELLRKIDAGEDVRRSDLSDALVLGLASFIEDDAGEAVVVDVDTTQERREREAKRREEKAAYDALSSDDKMKALMWKISCEGVV